MGKFIRKVIRKWSYSLVGLSTAFKEEKSLWAYLAILPLLIGVGIWVNLSISNWAVVIITIFLVISIEVINTALEAAVDTISFQYNVKVKKIKDIAAGATLVITLGAIITLLVIYIPAIMEVI